MKNNIILCGFMGSGKTTVGRALAEFLDFSFVDLDQYIEARQGTTISKIFEEKGEAFFRNLESKAVAKLSKTKKLVLSLGGGTVLDPKNVEVLKKSGVIVFLDVTEKTVLSRLALDNTRPLLKENKKTAVSELLNSRRPIYSAAADFVVDGNKAGLNVVNQILTNIRSY